MTPLPQDIDFKADLAKVLYEVMASTHLSEGKFVKQLEEQVQRETGLHAVAVSNCGAGLFALYRVLGHRDIVVPTNTFYATGAMAREAGYTVRLADTAKDRFSMGLAEVIAAASPETTMVALTHVGGKLADEYTAIADHCRQNGLLLIEDAAHVLGVPGVGLLGDAAVFSLYPTKAVPAGEGGVIVTKHEALANDLRVFRNYGKYFDENGVIRYTAGFNLRMDEWTAAVASVQMARLAEIMEARHFAAMQLAQVIPPVPEFERAWTNWYKYPVKRSDAEKMGIKKRTGMIYQVSDQLTTAMFSDRDPLPNAAKLADDYVCLPVGEGMYEGMTDEQILLWLQEG